MKTKFKILTAFLLTFALILSVALIGAAEEPTETLVYSYSNDFSDSSSLPGGRWENYDRTIVELYDGSRYQKIQGKGQTMEKSDYYDFKPATAYSYADKTVDYAIFELDLATEGKVFNQLKMYFFSFEPGKSSAKSGAAFSITQDGENIKISGDGVNFTIPGGAHEWTHLTLIAEITDKDNPLTATTKLHFYADGVYQATSTSAKVLTGTSTCDRLAGVRLTQGGNGTEAASDTTLLIDNAAVKLYTKVSDGEGSLAYVLADTTRNLSEWTAGVWTEDYATTFPPSGVICAIGETPYASFQAAYDAVQDGEVIEIYQDVVEPFEITKPVKVDTNGYTFNYFSDTLILKEVNGNEYTFGEGEITVTWHYLDKNLEEKTHEVVYTSASTVSLPEEVANNLPEHLIYSTGEKGATLIRHSHGWKKSNTTGAEVYDASELGYVTPDNCNFYLNSYIVNSTVAVVEGDAVNGVLTEYSDGNLAAIVNALSSDSATVILNSDITLPSSVIITKDITIDFNTYSITYDGIHTMFIVRDGSLDLEGPGSINKTSKSSYVFDVEEDAGAEVKVNGVDIVATTVVANVQSGSLDVTNSTIKVEGADAVDAIVVKDADVSVSNSTIELEASDENSYAIKAEGSNVTLTGSTLSSNAGGLATDTNSSASLEEGTTVKAETAFGGETANVTLTEGVQISTNNGTENIPLPEGLVLAYTEDPDVPYLLTSDYVEVEWVVGTLSVTEYWVTGSKPAYKDATIDGALEAYQATNTDKTKRYAFIITKVSEDTKFEPQLVNVIAPMYNLELGMNLTVNIYVPTEQYGATTSSIEMGGEAVDLTKLKTAAIGSNTYYVITKSDILASKAGENIEYKVNFKVSDADYSLTFNTSAIKYCDAVLTAGTEAHSEEVLNTVKALLNYIDKSYKYAGTDSDTAYTEVAAVMTKHAIEFASPEYSDSVTDFVIDEDNDRVGAAGRFTDAYFVYDEGGARYEFVIAEGFSGRIKIMQGDDVVIYNATNGKIGGNSVIVYEPEVDQFLDVITVKYNDNRTIFVYDVTSFLADEDNDAKTQAYADALVIYCELVGEVPVIE